MKNKLTVDYFIHFKTLTAFFRNNYDEIISAVFRNFYILKISWQSCDLIGHYLFWHNSYDAEWKSLPKNNLRYTVEKMYSNKFIS
jgi:hypothetical protein